MDDNTTLRVASFSCYLDTSKDNILHKISAQNYPPKDPLSNLRVDSFSYLKMGPIKPENSVGSGAPSFCSETSSRDTRTAFQRNGSQTKKKKGPGKRIFFSGFGCKGPCFNRKDVVVHSNKETTLSTRAKVNKQKGEDQVANMEESRRSIEVFGSAGKLGGEIAKSLERKLSMLTWDAIPKAKNLPTSTIGSFCDDMASEASSDLFEIENISGLVLRDDVSMSPSSIYAPSEASIQWSVVTADYYPPNSDYNEEDGCKSFDVSPTRVSRKNIDQNQRKEFSFSMSNSQANQKALKIRT